MAYLPDISKETLNALPVCTYDGPIHLVSSVEEADKVARVLSEHRHLGFDTETKPSFTRGQSHKVALLQLATETDVYLFRLHQTGVTAGMAALLSDKAVAKIGVAVSQDIRQLKRWRPFNEGGFLDLQDFVKPFGIESNGLSKLAGIVLGCRISKAQQLSNWENGELTSGQMRYAAIDAWASYRIFAALSASTNHG